MKSAENTYELWQPDPRYQLPPRSTLARLEPIGFGGPYVESLSSYYLRLAHLHRFSPITLAKYIIAPNIRNSDKPVFKDPLFYWNKPYFNGVAHTPYIWAKQLGKLTGLKNLDQLTFCSLKFLFPSAQLIARNKRWCPFCYDESCDKDQMYDQLLWDVDTVTACPIHNTKLVGHCACDPKSSLHLTNAKRLPGFCRFCGGKLTEAPRTDIEKAGKHEIQRAKLVADFIANRAIISNLKIKDSLGFLKFMRGVISEHTNGNAYEFGKLLMISKSKLSEWLNGHHRPVFPQVVNIAKACNCSIVDVYLGDYKKVNKVAQLYPDSRKAISIPYRRKKSRKKITETTLKAYLVKKNPMSLSKVAEELNSSPKCLRNHFGDIAAQIVKNYQEFIKRKAEIRLNAMVHEYKMVAERLLERAIKPTHKKIISELGHKMWDFDNKKIYRNIINEVIQKGL